MEIIDLMVITFILKRWDKYQTFQEGKICLGSQTIPTYKLALSLRKLSGS